MFSEGVESDETLAGRAPQAGPGKVRADASPFLDEAERRFEIMANGAPVLIWIAGPDARRNWFNERWLAFTGRKLEQEVGDGWREGIHPEDLHRCLDVYLSAFHARRSFRMEYRLRRADGQYRYIASEGVPLHAADGGFTGYIGSCMDVHERTEAEQAVRHSEQRYRSLAWATNAIVFITDARGLLTAPQMSWEAYTGQRWPEYARGGGINAVHPDDRPLVQAKWDRCVAERCVYEVEYRLWHESTREYRYCLARSVSVIEPDGQIREWVGTLVDVHDRRMAEEAVRRAEANLRALNESLEAEVQRRTAWIQLLQEIASIANASDTVPDAMRQAIDRVCRHTGWEFGQVWMVSEDRTRLTDSHIWYGDQQAAGFAALRDATDRVSLAHGEGLPGRVLAAAEPEWIRDIHEPNSGFLRAALRPDIPAKSAIAFPVMIERRVEAVVEFFSSVSAEPDPAAMEVFRHIGAQLGRTVERERFRRQLVDAVWERQREFGQDLHDHVGQQITGIGLLVHSLEQELKRQKLPQVETVRKLAEHVRTAQHQIRDLARGMFPVEIDAHGLMTALDHLADSCRQVNGVQCTFGCDAPVTISDNRVATHLFRIAQEAVNNAIRHGGAKHVDIRLLSEAGATTLQITDDGVGIAAGSDENAGMGLRIMRYRAALIGAAFSIERQAEGGTVVRCTLNRG